MGFLRKQFSGLMAVVFLFLLFAIAPVLLLVSRTTRGRFAGLAGAVLWAASIFLLNLPRNGNNSHFGIAALLAMSASYIFILNWLPDTDFIRMALFLAWFDPRVSRRELRAARLQMHELLVRVEAEPETWTERPLWPVAILGLMSQQGLREGHYYFYRPAPKDPGEKFGLVIALHGHGGNSRVWLESWKAFADEFRLAVVCPTLGYGNWEDSNGVRVVERCLSIGKSWHGRFDPSRVFLAGISQGGCGVGRAGATLADHFAGLVFLSSAMEQDVLGSECFVMGWRNKPVIVIQGQRDRHVKPKTVVACVERMKAGGVNVTTHFEVDGGHFLFFAQHADVFERIGKWMKATSRR